MAAFSVHVDKGASDKDVKEVGGFEGERVEGVGEGEGGEGGDGLGGGGEGVVVGAETMAEHAAEGAESEEREIILCESGDEGTPCGRGFVREREKELV